jgi:hypothetical protein
MVNINKLIQKTVQVIPSPIIGNRANLILDFEIGTGLFVEDEIGNQIEQKTIYVCNASVTQEANNKEYEMPGQVGTASIVLSGRYVNPKIPPTAIGAESKCSATLYYWDELSQLFVGQTKGIFTFIPVVQNRFSAFNDRFGAKIKGYFSTIARV